MNIEIAGLCSFNIADPRSRQGFTAAGLKNTLIGPEMASAETPTLVWTY
jgi:hypothetical protein